MFKFLFLLLLGYYAYTYLIKPNMPKVSSKKEDENFRFEKKAKPEKRAHDDDYIDYEEIE